MTHDDSQDRGDKHSQSDERARDDLAPLTVNTTDPVIESVVDHPSDWKLHPDAIIRAETSPMSDAELPGISGVRTIVLQSRPSNDSSKSRDDGRGRSQRNRDHQQEEDDSDDHPSRPERQRQRQPSMMKILLITAGVALVGGVFGAFGYSYFFGSKSKGSSPDQSQNKSESGSSDSSGGSSNSSNSMNSSDMSGTKQGLSFEQRPDGAKHQGSGEESNVQASTGILTPERPASVDTDTSRRLKELNDKVERLNERLEEMTRSRNGTPPGLRTVRDAS